MTLQELLNLVVNPYMPEKLIDKLNMERIGKVASFFPNRLTSFFGFECRLGELEPKGDFLFCIRQANQERQILAGNDEVKGIPNVLLENEVWRRIVNFSKHWDMVESPLYSADNIWMELDMDDIDLDKPIPSFFFGFNDNKKWEELKQICEIAFNELLGKAIDKQIFKNLIHCFKLLPAHARVFQIGLMLSRNTEGIRLCIQNLRPVEIPTFLMKLGWPGNPEELNLLLEQLEGNVDHINLDIDIGMEILPKVGLECYIDPDQKANDKWKDFLDLLTEGGLCKPEKREALKTYFGVTNRFMCNKIWPEHWLVASASLKNKQLSTYVRFPNHIKLSFEPNKPLEAKIYLGTKHAWIPTKQLVEAYNLRTGNNIKMKSEK